jgi:transglycosylase-like protein with SLT domain/D-alanyl-D-alanine carboxypeptidase-like protein
VSAAAATVQAPALCRPGEPPRPGGSCPASALAPAGERGQALLVLLAALCVVLVAAVALGGVARGIGVRGRAQRAADLGALAGARAMRADYDRLFAPAYVDGRANPRHLERFEYLARARARARAVARANGAEHADVTFPDGGSFAPTRIQVRARETAAVRFGGARRSTAVDAVAEAQLSADAVGGTAPAPGAGDYPGPFAYRQGKPMRPDVARAFDRLAAAAAHDGVALVIVSAFRSSAEQARLFAAHPDPRWVAPPGRSLHRLGTELDLGPAGAYGWLAAHAPAFHFVKRYAWEPWHFGFVLDPGTTSVGYGGDGRGAVPAFVPPRFAPAIAAAAQRWNVSAALLAAQLYAESGFNPFAVSRAGARGIAQFTPATARAYGLADPFDAAHAIDAQGHLMRDLLRRFGSVPLALAAYNAGPAPVARCGCVPPYPETQAYVTRILGLLRGAGDTTGLGAGLDIRLVR